MESNVKQEDGRFKIVRGPGSGYSLGFFPNQDKELPDANAKIEFNKGYRFDDQFSLTIDFGYTSPSGKNYSRDISLTIDQTLALANYLNNLVIDHLRAKNSKDREK